MLPKTSSGVFNSTNLDYVLRNLGIENVIVAGFVTDQCVDMAIRDGADRGYYMVCADRRLRRLHGRAARDGTAGVRRLLPLAVGRGGTVGSRAIGRAAGQLVKGGGRL